MDNPHKLLLEIILQPAMTRPSGMRVYADGRYHYMEGNSGWYDVWQFTTEEMKVLKQAITAANIPALKSHYPPQYLVDDGVTTLWQVNVDGQDYHISLPPGARVSALDNLYHTFSTLRKLSPERSHWRVWQPDGTYREFTILGSINAVDALRPLIVAMFVPHATSPEGNLDIPPKILLVETQWITEEKTEQTQLYSDGRYLRGVEGNLTEEKKLGNDQVQNVLRSIQAIDWSKIPAQIDAT
jgi:hypothetical protein